MRMVIVNRRKSYFSHLLNVHNVSDVRQTEKHTAEPLVPGPSHVEVEISILKLKKYKSPDSAEIPAELYQWKESIIVPIHKRGDKTDCNIYRGISLLSTSYKILSNILLARLSPYIDEIIGDHQCGFQRNRSDHIFCIHQILENKWEYNERVHQLFVDIKKAYDSVRREVLYNILIEAGITMKLVRLLRMCLNETYSKVHIGKHMSDSFLI
jgi:hypothetical protein